MNTYISVFNKRQIKMWSLKNLVGYSPGLDKKLHSSACKVCRRVK